MKYIFAIATILVAAAIPLSICHNIENLRDTYANSLQVGQVWCQPLDDYHQGDTFNPPKKNCAKVKALTEEWVQYTKDDESYNGYSLKRRDFVFLYSIKE